MYFTFEVHFGSSGVHVEHGEAQHFIVDNAFAPFRRIYFKEFRFQPRTDRAFRFHERDI